MKFVIYNTDRFYTNTVVCGGAMPVDLEDLWEGHIHIMVNFEDDIKAMNVGDSIDVHDEDDNYKLRRTA